MARLLYIQQLIIANVHLISAHLCTEIPNRIKVPTESLLKDHLVIWWYEKKI